MFCSRRCLPLAGLLCLLISACSRNQPKSVERLAILPLENLSDDSSVAWAGLGITEVAASQADGSGALHVMRIAGERTLATSGADSALRGYIVVRDGRIRLHAARQNLSNQRVDAAFESEEAFPAGLFRIAGALAAWIQPHPKPFDTQNIDALRAFVEGREAEDEASAARAYQRAIDLDRNFGAPYVAWTQALLMKGDRGAASRIVALAKAQGNRISAARLAELELLDSATTGDKNIRRSALLALSRSSPANAELFRQLGAEDYAAHRYDTAAGFYRQATQLDPTDVSAWNQLGYTEALRRNLEGARSALAEYARLAPRDANPSDSLGDVHYFLGAFREAEKYYLEGHEKNPGFLNGAELYKAARARLMTGDLSGADELFRRYTAVRKAAQDPLTAYGQNQWLYLTGRKQEAVAQMTKVAESAAAPIVRSMAASQLAIWSLDSGDRQQAALWTGRAAAAPPSPLSSRYVELCRALLAPPASESSGSDDQGRQLAAINLLLNKKFAEAVPGLELLAKQSSPMSSDGAQVLLAWALVETGHFREALPLLEKYGIPPRGFEEPLACLSFPRLLQLRAVVLEKAGRSQEAAASREVFRKLSGNQRL